MKVTILFLLIHQLFLAQACLNIIRDGVNTLSNNLYDVVAKGGINLVFSPIAIHNLLYMITKESPVRTSTNFLQLLKAKDLQANHYKTFWGKLDPDGRNITMKLSNKLYVREGLRLKNEFVRMSSEYYGVDVVRNVEVINAKVNFELSNYLRSNADMILLSEAYFKGRWLAEFDMLRTTLEQFFVSETMTLPCQMMRLSGRARVTDHPYLQAQIIQLQYADQRFSMFILLPNWKTGLPALEAKLGNATRAGGQNLNDFIRTSKMEERQIMLTMPKFKVETVIDLNNPLEQIGFGDFFSNVHVPDILDSTMQKLNVKQMIQKTVVEVDEQGFSERGGFETRRGRYPTTMDINVDHPYIFYITTALEGDAQTILFMGKMTTPNLFQSRPLR